MFTGYNFIDILINLVLALIMLGIGLSLTVLDFKKLYAHPHSLFTALGIQLILIPAVAFAIASVSGLSYPVKVGIVVVSLCASGASSNLITHLFKGNVALAISMTAINSLITLVSIPLLADLALYVFTGVGKQIWLPVPETIFQIFMITIIPAGIGVLIRKKKERFAIKAERPLKIILPLLLVSVFTLKIFLNLASGGTGITSRETFMILPFMLLLNFAAMLTGFIISRSAKLPFADQFTVAIEVGLHNTALALLITGTILKNPDMEKPAVVYAMFSFFTAVLFVYLIKLIFKKRSVDPS